MIMTSDHASSKLDKAGNAVARNISTIHESGPRAITSGARGNPTKWTAEWTTVSLRGIAAICYALVPAVSEGIAVSEVVGDSASVRLTVAAAPGMFVFSAFGGA